MGSGGKLHGCRLRRLGLSATVTAGAPSLHLLELVAGNRCISIGHDCVVGPELLAALRASGVTYVSTRSAGTDHIDVLDARHHGIVVENVEYSADSVADHTLCPRLDAPATPERVLDAIDALRERAA